MARYVSEEKAGYYPTPVMQVMLICDRLRADPGAKINAFDPCAGEGHALASFAKALKEQGAEVTTYGIEIEKSRAEKAKRRLDRVICSPYEDTRVTPHSMSFMWLNPPYNSRGGEHAEAVFLRDLTDSSNGKLQPGGLLGFCIPQYVLKDVATTLAVRFDNISVYKFAGYDYNVYRQIVVFGYRRKYMNPEYREEKERLEELAAGDLPTLEEAGDIYVPPALYEVLTFRSNFPEPEEVKNAIQNSPVWEKLKAYEIKPRAVLKQPVLPLKTTHIAVAIAAGAVGGNMGTHLLVGTTKRVKIREEIPDEDGSTVIETEESRSIVRLFDKSGIHVLE